MRMRIFHGFCFLFMCCAMTAQAMGWNLPFGATDGLGTLSIAQPDLHIRIPAEANYSGDNIYSLDGINQKKMLEMPANASATYLFRIQNDGNAADTFTVTGSPTASGWSVYYKRSDTGADITAAVTGTGWSTGSLAPGAFKGIFVQVVPWFTLPAGAGKVILVTATSASDTTKKDVVKTVTTVSTRRQPDLWIRKVPDANFGGNNIYNLTGADQERTATVAANATATYAFAVQNDGNIADTLKVTGPAGGNGWTVQYYTNTGANITAAVTGSGWNTAVMAAGTYVGIYVKITATTAATGTAKTLLLTATSAADATKQDVVKSVTTQQVRLIDYMPSITIGNKRYMICTLVHTGEVYSESAISQVSIGGSPAMKLEERYGNSLEYRYAWNDANHSIFFGFDNGTTISRLTPPVELPATMTIGQALTATGNWVVNGQSQGSYSITTTLVQRGTVVVPAGTFTDCIQTRIDVQIPGQGASTDLQWSARGIGLVKVLYGDGSVYELTGAIINGQTYGTLPPTITGFTPSSGPAGTVVTVNGTNLTGTTAVKFNGTTATFTNVTATSLKATVPAGASTGKISVTTPGGTAVSSANFTISTSGAHPWIGHWVQVNFLGDDDGGVWGDDDPTGIGFVADITNTNWVETDDYGNGDSLTYTYSVDANYHITKVIYYFGIQYTETGRLEFSDGGDTMIEYYDPTPDDVPGETIVAFKWSRR